jgi:dTDP-4-amino-4,6-dideoxy-D-galactose acyltransferase
MTPRTSPTIAPLVARLDWESDHFGVPAARLTDAALDDASLEAALQQARGQGVQWLVWATDGTRSAGPSLLERFAGHLVDRKATFVRSLVSAETIADDCRPDASPVVEYTAAVASEALVDLAVASGEYSRFRLDPMLSDERFVAMYRRWIERSVAKELADAVLVVECRDIPGSAGRTLAGMISVSESRGVGSIGLVAVAAAARGRGIGSKLIQGAHQWMRGRGAREARVVTQMVNTPACRLYERAGYQLARVQHIYHFWPQAVRPLSDAGYRRAA